MPTWQICEREWYTMPRISSWRVSWSTGNKGDAILYPFSWKIPMPARPRGISRKFPLWPLSSLREKTAEILYPPRQETRFQKSIAVLSPGNNLILDENWLHEQRGCLNPLPGLWEQIQQDSEPLLISYTAQPVFLYFVIRPRHIFFILNTPTQAVIFSFLMKKLPICIVKK